MKLHIITIGAPHLAFAKEGFAEYVKRLGRFHDIHVTHIKDGKDASTKMLRLCTGYTIALDEHGEQWTSRKFAAILERKAVQGVSEMTFLVGGPDGHTEEILNHVQKKWSLGKHTLPHDLAMVVVAEGLYRASTITAGHPYHRE